MIVGSRLVVGCNTELGNGRVQVQSRERYRKPLDW